MSTYKEIWFNYKELEPTDPNPPYRFKPKPPKGLRKGQKPRDKKPHERAKLKPKDAFGRHDFAKRIRQITGESLPRCRMHVNAFLAVLLSELEIGHPVDLPHIGMLMFEEVPKIRYRSLADGLFYIRPISKKMVLSTYQTFDTTVKRNCRQVDWTDHCDPRLTKIFTYVDAP